MEHAGGFLKPRVSLDKEHPCRIPHHVTAVVAGEGCRVPHCLARQVPRSLAAAVAAKSGGRWSATVTRWRIASSGRNASVWGHAVCPQRTSATGAVLSSGSLRTKRSSCSSRGGSRCASSTASSGCRPCWVARVHRVSRTCRSVASGNWAGGVPSRWASCRWHGRGVPSSEAGRGCGRYGLGDKSPSPPVTRHCSPPRPPR